MVNRGAILVLALCAAGLLAASAAVWYQRRQTHQALGLWGAEVASRIESAAIVELIELDHQSRADSESTGDARHLGTIVDISHARGLVHFRRSLLQDVNFDWESEERPGEQGELENDWDYAVRFSGDIGSVVLLFDLNRGMVASRAIPGKVGRLTDRMTQALARFFDETLAQTSEVRD